VQQQGSRLEGARAQVQRLLADYRRQKQADPAEQTPLELEVDAVVQRSANRVLIDGLTQLSAADQNLALALENKMSEAGIQPPAEEPGLEDDGDGIE